jgi:hypothetical protein
MEEGICFDALLIRIKCSIHVARFGHTLPKPFFRKTKSIQPSVDPARTQSGPDPLRYTH